MPAPTGAPVNAGAPEPQGKKLQTQIDSGKGRMDSDNYRRRVVVTGIGLVSPVGIGIEENWSNLISGKSGIGPITRFDCSAYATKIAGEVKNFHPEEFISKKELRKMDPFLRLALGAAHYAMEDAGFKIAPGVSHRVGVVIGCGLGGLLTIEESHKQLLEPVPKKSALFSSR